MVDDNGFSTINDLSPYERGLLRDLNKLYKTSYTYKNFMEWSASKKIAEDNLEEGEKLYRLLGIHIAIKV